MKVKVLTGRMWTFLRRKRARDHHSFVAIFFRKKSGARGNTALPEPEHVQDNGDAFQDSFVGEFLEQGPALNGDGRGAASGRLSFDGREGAGGPAMLSSRGGGAGALSSRRLSSFRGLVLEEEEAAAAAAAAAAVGPAVSSKGGPAGRSSRRLSFSGLLQTHLEAGRTSTSKGAPGDPPRPSFTVQPPGPEQQQPQQQLGPAITSKGDAGSRSSRRLSFSLSGLGKDDQGSHSKRHMQMITMWNPASSAASTVESPTENSPKIWLRQASKKWREFGSGRRSVDPIENGPEGIGSENDWRRKIFDIDPDRRWPVQGWG